jgi:hypothetical protein
MNTHNSRSKNKNKNKSCGFKIKYKKKKGLKQNIKRLTRGDEKWRSGLIS